MYRIKDKPKSTIILIGMFGGFNTGDEAILASELSMVKGIYPNARIIVISYNPEYTFSIYNVESIKNPGIGFGWFKYGKTIIKEIRNSSLIIIGGGGIIQDVHSCWAVARYFQFAFLAKLFAKKVITLALGVGPLKSKFVRWFTKVVFKLPDCISVRDKYSYNYLKNLGVDKTVNITSDPAFLLKMKESYKNRNISKSKLKIGFALRNWINLDITSLVKTIEWLICELNAEVILIPFEFSYKSKLGSDIDFIKYLFRKINVPNIKKQNLVIKCNMMDYQKIMDIISKLDLLIAMRFHAIIFSFLQNIPVIGIVYDEKVRELFREFNILSFILKPQCLSSLNTMILKCLSGRDIIYIGYYNVLVSQRSMASINMNILNDIKSKNSSRDFVSLIKVMLAFILIYIYKGFPSILKFAFCKIKKKKYANHKNNDRELI